MTSDFIHQILDYHYWARDRLLLATDALSAEQYARPMGNSFSSIRDTLNHIYQAESLWYSRWNGVSPTTFPSDDLPDVASLRSRWTALELKVREHVAGAGVTGLQRILQYRLMNGTEGASPLWQMVVHVVNHGTYHRGQVTTMLRQLGVAPAQSLDMITYFRERGA